MVKLVNDSNARLGRPVDADGDATRTRVLAAARTAFAELGYAATTYRLLAERTGLAPSALYNYFASKAELFVAVHEEVQMETYTEWILPAITDTTTMAERLDGLLHSFAAMNKKAPEAARFQAAARIDTARHHELAQLHNNLPKQRTKLFTEMVALGIANGEVDPSQRKTLLAMLETLTVGLVEVAANPTQHRLAVEGFRSAITALGHKQ